MLSELISTKLRYYRKKQRLTLEQLSEKSGLDDTYIGRIERNEINITIQTLEKLLDGLNLTTEEFFGSLENTEKDLEVAELIDKIMNSSKKEKILDGIRLLVELSN